ncbi:hypothetical protein H5410_032849 [Solanum commersonii]|uniref:Uncharacterized protein n=1 Tax=Solanum commersonii TaxID=4109 RepID=A0A9J5YP26_SOLCO|nr:hypothetical protein H5410_032849 [Solanum commersonii]
MVGIFPRFSVSRVGHRRTQSALDEREVFPPNSEATIDRASSGTTHGVEFAVECKLVKHPSEPFKPVKHPSEPLEIDRPIQCPFPEPSVLNEGRIWKERGSSVRIGRPEGRATDSMATRTIPMNRVILPSMSAPEHSLLKLLEESGIC